MQCLQIAVYISRATSSRDSCPPVGYFAQDTKFQLAGALNAAVSPPRKLARATFAPPQLVKTIVHIQIWVRIETRNGATILWRGRFSPFFTYLDVEKVFLFLSLYFSFSLSLEILTELPAVGYEWCAWRSLGAPLSAPDTTEVVAWLASDVARRTVLSYLSQVPWLRSVKAGDATNRLFVCCVYLSFLLLPSLSFFPPLLLISLFDLQYRNLHRTKAGVLSACSRANSRASVAPKFTEHFSSAYAF